MALTSNRSAASRGRQRNVRARAKPEDRSREFIAKAVELFAEVGFDASTRELANRLNVTQPLLYRYFPSKDDLIDAVYKEIYLNRWKKSWQACLTDTSRPLVDRMQEFYNDYTDTIFTPDWLRIYLFAGLRDVRINNRYMKELETLILIPILQEYRRERGLRVSKKCKPEEVELFWTLQGGIFYYGVREVVYGIKLETGRNQMIKNAVTTFLKGAENVVK